MDKFSVFNKGCGSYCIDLKDLNSCWLMLDCELGALGSVLDHQANADREWSGQNITGLSNLNGHNGRGEEVRVTDKDSAAQE